MTTSIYSNTIYKNNKANVIETYGADQIKIQGIGSGTYTIKGRLSKNCEWDTVCAIKASDYSKGSIITDASIWIADIAGYSHVTVDASGFTEIYATILG